MKENVSGCFFSEHSVVVSWNCRVQRVYLYVIKWIRSVFSSSDDGKNTAPIYLSYVNFHNFTAQ